MILAMLLEEKTTKETRQQSLSQGLRSLERGGLLRLFILFTAVVRQSQTSKSRTNTPF